MALWEALTSATQSPELIEGDTYYIVSNSMLRMIEDCLLGGLRAQEIDLVGNRDLVTKEDDGELVLSDEVCEERDFLYLAETSWERIESSFSSVDIALPVPCISIKGCLFLETHKLKLDVLYSGARNQIFRTSRNELVSELALQLQERGASLFEGKYKEDPKYRKGVGKTAIVSIPRIGIEIVTKKSSSWKDMKVSSLCLFQFEPVRVSFI